MKKILMILTSHRLDCFRLAMDCLHHTGSLTRFDQVVLMLNGVKGKHLDYVNRFMSEHPEVNWDTVSGPRGKHQFVANLQNETVKRYPEALYFKMDEDLFVSPGWVDKLTTAYEAFKGDPDLALITPVIPNNAAGAFYLMNRFPELGAAYREKFGLALNHDFNGPVWANPFVAEWLIRSFIDMEAANVKLAGDNENPYQPFDYRFSINTLVYDYRHWQEMGGIPDEEEAAWTGWVKEKGKFNVLVTNTLLQHYCFFVQQDWLDRTHILEELREANIDKRSMTPLIREWQRTARVARQMPHALPRKLKSLVGKG